MPCAFRASQYPSRRSLPTLSSSASATRIAIRVCPDRIRYSTIRALSLRSSTLMLEYSFLLMFSGIDPAVLNTNGTVSFFSFSSEWENRPPRNMIPRRRFSLTTFCATSTSFSSASTWDSSIE